MGATAIRSAVALAGLKLSGPDKAGMDAATFARLDEPTGVAAALAGCDAVAYMASGDIRPEACGACARASQWARRRTRSSPGVGRAPLSGRRGGRLRVARQRRRPRLGQ